MPSSSVGDTAERTDQVDRDCELKLLHRVEFDRAPSPCREPTVLAALATPAQLTSTRSCPCAARAFGKRRRDLLVAGDVDLTENYPIADATCSPLARYRDRTLRPLSPAPGELARRRFAEPRCGAGHHRGNSLDIHCRPFRSARGVLPHRGRAYAMEVGYLQEASRRTLARSSRPTGTSKTHSVSRSD